MGRRINIQPVALSATAANLLNGAFASLSGPVGFTPTQPRIRVTKIVATCMSSSSPVEFAVYKGVSGGSAAGTEVGAGTVGFYNGVAPTATIPVDTILDAGDFLTGKTISGGSVTLDISAEIEF